MGCFLLFAQSALASAAEKPINVLMVGIDDFKAIGTLFQGGTNDYLAMVYPDPELRREVAGRITPNLQRLVNRGVNFKRAYTPSPASNPARAAVHLNQGFDGSLSSGGNVDHNGAAGIFYSGRGRTSPGVI